VVTDGFACCPVREPYDADAISTRVRAAARRAGVAERLARVEVVLLREPYDATAASAAAARIGQPTCERRPPSPPADSGDTLVFDWFPDVVAVGVGGSWSCSGVMVGDRPQAPHARGRVVLTARHCLPADRIAVTGAIARSARQVMVTRAIPHPDPHVDAALLFLANRVDVPTHVSRTSADTSEPRGVARIVGFGADDATGEHGAGDLHHVELTTTGWGCDTHRAEALGCQAGIEMAIRGNGGHDSCRGDSGAPVFERLECGWRLIGITSRAMASAHRRCGDGGIYTRIDAIDRWLNEQLRFAAEELE
jgi:hypothetical protein